MKTKAPVAPEPAASEPAKRRAPPPGKIHPVVIYPFRQPSDYSDVVELYGFDRLAGRRQGPLHAPGIDHTVVDRKTFFRAEKE